MTIMTIIMHFDIFIYAGKWIAAKPSFAVLTCNDNKASIYLKGDGWIDNGKHHAVVVEEN